MQSSSGSRSPDQYALVVVPKSLDGDLRKRGKVTDLQHASLFRVSSKGRVKRYFAAGLSITRKRPTAALSPRSACDSGRSCNRPCHRGAPCRIALWQNERDLFRPHVEAMKLSCAGQAMRRDIS